MHKNIIRWIGKIETRNFATAKNQPGYAKDVYVSRSRETHKQRFEVIIYSALLPSTPFE